MAVTINERRRAPLPERRPGLSRVVSIPSQRASFPVSPASGMRLATVYADWTDPERRAQQIAGPGRRPDERRITYRFHRPCSPTERNGSRRIGFDPAGAVFTLPRSVTVTLLGYLQSSTTRVSPNKQGLLKRSTVGKIIIVIPT